MKQTLTITALLLSASCLSFPAHAENDGLLDCKWFEGRIMATAPIALDSSLGILVKHLKADSGKSNCYVALEWLGQDSYVYQMHPVCKQGDGTWEQGAFLNNARLFELSDGQSLASDWTSLYFAQNGGYFYDTDAPNGDLPSNHAYIGYEGTMVMTPKFKNGQITNIAVQAKYGMIYSWNNNLALGGSAPTGLVQLRYITSEQVPTAVKTAAGVCD